MKVNFIHLADVHLGHEQYGQRERAEDFARAFYFVVDYAIESRVDFVIVAGDLFERSTLDPVTFDQTLSGLKQLAMADIPVIAIAGNHDRARYGQGMAWLESLGRQGFLIYLDAASPDGIKLERWQSEDGSGGYLEMKGVRVAGMRYLGASTARAVSELADRLKAISGPTRPYTIVLIHAGLDGVVPNFRAELSYDQLAPLRGVADYVALGHIHKHYVREGWVYNPGSLETWNVGEVGWERGFIHVKVDTAIEPKHTVRLIAPPRRPFLRFRLDVEPCTSPQELLELLRRSAADWAGINCPAKPVVHITLAGRLRFDRRDLDLGALEAELVDILQPLVVRIQDQTDETAFQVRVIEEGGTLDRGALELEVLRQLFANDERRVHQASRWAALAQALKQGILSKEDPARLAEQVRREIAELSLVDPKKAEQLSLALKNGQ